MGQIAVSNHIHKQLNELKEENEHKSLDSVIRVLIERAKRVEGDNILDVIDDSEFGTVEVTAGESRNGADIDQLLPPENPTREEAIQYLESLPVRVDKENLIQTFEVMVDEHNAERTEAMLSQAKSAIESVEVRPHLDEKAVAARLSDSLLTEDIDVEIVLDHISALVNSQLMLDPPYIEPLLLDHYENEGTPELTERTLEVDLDEVIALIQEVEESDTPRRTARELLTAGRDNDYSWGTIWFLAPLSPDVSRSMSSSGAISVGKSTGMAWTCDSCGVEGHHTTIQAVRINEFSEVSQVQCGRCDEWSDYALHERFPVGDGSDVRLEWESEQPT